MSVYLWHSDIEMFETPCSKEQGHVDILFLHIKYQAALVRLPQDAQSPSSHVKWRHSRGKSIASPPATTPPMCVITLSEQGGRVKCLRAM